MMRTVADLMRNVATELDTLAQCAKALEAETSGIVNHVAVNDAERHRLLVVFQGLDLMIQALEDFSRLAEASATGGLASAAIDEQLVREHVRLHSLADRLLGKPAPPHPENRPTDFLL